MLKSSFYFIMLFYPVLGGGQDLKDWSSASIQSFKIQIPHLQITFQESSSSSYQVESKNPHLTMTNNKGELTIQSKDFLSPSLFARALSKNKVKLKISGPPKPIFIGTGHSQIQFFGWKSPVFISGLTGQLKSLNTSGDWHIGLKSGSVNIKKHKGNIKLKSFHTNANIQDSQGVFNLELNEGSLKLKSSRGSVELTGDQADILFTKFRGDLKAFSRSGAIKASLIPGDIKIQTQRAPVSLQVMEHGASVSAYTERGKMHVPRYLNKKFEGKSTRISGRLLSKIKKGDIFIESERGNIYIQ